MKKPFQYISVFLIALVMMGCQTEELPIAEDSISARARAWFEKEHDPKLNDNPSYYGEPDWENFIEIGNTYYFPLIPDPNNDNEYNSPGKMLGKSFIALTEKPDNSFEEVLTILFHSNISTSKAGNNGDGQNYIFYDSNNSVSEFVLPVDVLSSEIIKSSSDSKIVSKGDCQTIGIYMTIHYTDGSSERYCFILMKHVRKALTKTVLVLAGAEKIH